jgi:hypothetical protein
LEEKFNDFELHHIRRQDNEAADAPTRLGSSHETPPPSGMFVQDLFKLSIWIRGPTEQRKPDTRVEDPARCRKPGTNFKS